MTRPEKKALPPRLARLILHFILRRRDREDYTPELDELFGEKVRRDGPRKASTWYWRQLLGFTIRWRSIRPAPESAAVRQTRRGGAIAMGGFAQEFRIGARRLRREPTFAASVALTLSIGVGASTAVFGVASTTLLSRIPFPEAERLVVARTTYRGSPEGTFNGVSFPNYADYRESSRSFEGLAALWDGIQYVTVTGRDEPWVARTSYCTWNLFSTLGVTPVLGRSFLAEEEDLEEATVVLISFELWMSRFGGSREVLGETIVLEGSPHTIVGVLPRSFRFLWDVDVWRVVTRSGETRDTNGFYAVGRLGPNISLPQAQSDVEAIALALEQAYPETNESASLRLTSLHRFLGGGVRQGLLMPAAATACLLLLACANVAGLLLARGQRRMSEVAVRAALGASRGSLARQLLSETVILTFPAGALGIAIAYGLQRVLLHLVSMGYLGVSEPIIDGPVLLFALCASLAMGLLVGILPALRGAVLSPSLHLAAGHRLKERRDGARLRNGLVALQISMSVVLLVGSGLVSRSLFHLTGVDLGFSTEQVLSVGIRIPASVNQAREDGTGSFPSILEGIRALPGVRSAGSISRWPIRSPGGNWRTRAGDRPLEGGDPGTLAYLRRTSPGFFPTVGMPILMGRDFQETDREGAPAVAVLSETLARSLFPEGDPVGRSVNLILSWIERREAGYEVVGVVQDAHLNNPRVGNDPVLYLSALQARPTWSGIAVRTEGDPTGLAEAIRNTVRGAEPDAIVTDLVPMSEMIDGAFGDFRRVARYLGAFTGIALLLAAVGLYGALAFHVGQQEHEIGVRMATGATRAGILGLVLRRGAWLVCIGLSAGLVGAYPGTALVRDLLFQTGPLDPLTYLWAVGVLLLVAAAACIGPALRATQVDPVVVLKGE